MDKNQPASFYDQKKVESIDEFLGSIHEKWLKNSDKRLLVYIEKDMAEITEAENWESLVGYFTTLGILNVAADLIDAKTCARETKDRLTQFLSASYALGLENPRDTFVKSEMPDSVEGILNIISYPLTHYAHDLIRGLAELGLNSDEEIEKYEEFEKDFDTSMAGINASIKNNAEICYSKGLLTSSTLQIVNLEEIAQINHLEKIIPFLKKYERKIRELKKVFNRYPGFFGSKQKWERKVLVIAQELAEISNHLPDKDRPGDKDNFWACLYKINEISESILNNWSHYLNDPSVVGVFQSMEQTRRYMEKIANYSDKLEMAIDKLENSVKSQD